MRRRQLVSALALALCSATPSVAQPGGADLARFVPGKWTTDNGKAAIEIESLKDGTVAGKWLDITGITYPIATPWVQNRTASGKFENGVLHLVLPTGSKLELRLGPDGSVLSGSRQTVGNNSFNPGLSQVSFKRN